jgi:Icc-related predicted phosphoesterase
VTPSIIAHLTDVHRSAEVMMSLDRIVSGAEVLVMSGDITSFGAPGFLRDFLDALSRLLVPTLLVPGNNEGPELVTPPKVHNIDGRKETLGGLLFGGVGGSLSTPFGTPNEITELEISAKLKELGRVDVLVSHMPPYGTTLDTAADGAHLGSESVLRYLREMKPKALLCGHVHESRSVETLHGCVCCNPGAAALGSYATLNVDKEISVDLRRI